MTSSSFLSLFFLIYLLPLSLSQSSRGVLIDCGATVPSVIDGLEWLPDDGYVFAGSPKNLTSPTEVPILSTVRTFPFQDNVRRKFCYVVPVLRNKRYLVRTTYFYGGVNGNPLPPVFDQIVDGTLWSAVNTTEYYLRGRSSYYEGVFRSAGKTMSVCVAANSYTDSDPFISALELVPLSDSLYNSTDFEIHALRLVARHSFGHSGSIIRYPDDQFNRYWEPLGESEPAKGSARNISVSGFWNIPPLKVFQTDLTNGQPVAMEIQWPPYYLPNATYYIALYFAEDQNSASGSRRVFDISINGVNYYKNLNVNPAGVAVFATLWPLAGLTKLALTPATGSSIGPLVNAGEAFEVLLRGGKTHTRDVIALEEVKNSLKNPPLDWTGDPCLPSQYSWTGVTCSQGPRIRVIALNLTGMGLYGSLSPNVANLTALSVIWLGSNSLSGQIPDLSSLKILRTLHLEENDLTGSIPPSLGNNTRLQQIFLQGNNLTGEVPKSLTEKPGLDLRVLPGNPLLSRPQT